MRRVRTVGTSPELALRSVLHRSGHRFRVAYPIPGRTRRTIDIAFVRKRLAVFLDGCFWHGCPVHGSTPRTNSVFWSSKVAENKARDDDTTSYLRNMGWEVLRIWEHEPLDGAFEAVTRILSSLGTGEVA